MHGCMGGGSVFRSVSKNYCQDRILSLSGLDVSDISDLSPSGLDAGGIQLVQSFCTIFNAVTVILPVVCRNHSEGFQYLGVLFEEISVCSVYSTIEYRYLKHLTSRSDAHGICLRNIPS